MQEIIITTKGELENLINSSVRKALGDKTVQYANSEQDKIISIEEAMVFLNLAKQTLYGFTSKNVIPYIKRGKKLYFRKSDLQKWLLEGKRKSRAEIIKELE